MHGMQAPLYLNVFGQVHGPLPQLWVQGLRWLNPL